jgi:hypothetical protein
MICTEIGLHARPACLAANGCLVKARPFRPQTADISSQYYFSIASQQMFLPYSKFLGKAHEV